MSLRLKDAVEKYLEIAGGYGRPAALDDFKWNREDTERLFSALDEDYHISRYFHFSIAAGGHYSINGFPHTHVTIDAEIQTLL